MRSYLGFVSEDAIEGRTRVVAVQRLRTTRGTLTRVFITIIAKALITDRTMPNVGVAVNSVSISFKDSCWFHGVDRIR